MAVAGWRPRTRSRQRAGMGAASCGRRRRRRRRHARSDGQQRHADGAAWAAAGPQRLGRSGGTNVHARTRAAIRLDGCASRRAGPSDALVRDGSRHAARDASAARSAHGCADHASGWSHRCGARGSSRQSLQDGDGPAWLPRAPEARGDQRPSHDRPYLRRDDRPHRRADDRSVRCNMQPAACNMQPTTCILPHATCNLQHTPQHRSARRMGACHIVHVACLHGAVCTAGQATTWCKS